MFALNPTLVVTDTHVATRQLVGLARTFAIAITNGVPVENAVVKVIAN
jgi:hypothetical protein